MSARTEVPTVMKMLIVKTMRGPMIVPAGMDSLAMARRVAVSSSKLKYNLHIFYVNGYLKMH